MAAASSLSLQAEPDSPREREVAQREREMERSEEMKSHNSDKKGEKV